MCRYGRMFSTQTNWSCQRVLVLLSLFLLASVFGQTDQSFLTIIFSFVTQKACEQDANHFIGHTEKIFRKTCFISCYSRHVCHIMFTVVRIYRIRESTANMKKLGSELGRGWPKIQESKEDIKNVDKEHVSS